MKKQIFLLIFFANVLACQSTSNKTMTTEETPKTAQIEGIIAENGMVVSAHPLASEVGVAILKKGGNAFDASVATFFALAVVYPRAGNIGGGGFAVYRTAEGETATLDFREKAPALAHRDMFLDKKKQPITKLSLIGHLASGVPGAVDGMVELHKKKGSMAWADLVQPAIDLAQNGFELTQAEADVLNRFQNEFKEANLHTLPLVRANKWKKGEKIAYPDLGKTLERIRDKGRAGFYEGETADLIVKEMKRGKGIISHEDLKNYHSVWREALKGTYKDYTIISMPPPSSGGIALLQLLKGLEKYPISDWGFQNPKSIHLLSELERRAYADRSTYLGDPDFVKIPMDTLLNAEKIAEKNATISLEKATPSAKVKKEKKVESIESVETTHFSITDKSGNAVSLTTTINGYFGSKVMVERAGFFLNNEMDDFSVKSGVANQFGLTGGEANAIAPQKRMLSSMTPTIIEKNGKLFMVLGTPGGSTIITSVFQTFLNVAEYKMTLQQAVDTLRFHHQWMPDAINYEPNRFNAEQIRNLEKMGHKLVVQPSWGRVDAIMRREDGKYEGAGDKRGDDKAIGY